MNQCGTVRSEADSRRLPEGQGGDAESMRNAERGRGAGLRVGFTLVEVVVSLTILALILGAAVPSIRGIVREKQALGPVREFAEMARATRERALRTQRPYQIGLDAGGCYAAPFDPGYGGQASYDALRTEVEAKQLERQIEAASAARFGQDGENGASAETDDEEFLLRFEWPDGYRVRVRRFGDAEWLALEGSRVRHWVIQPTGLCLPLLLRFEADGVFAEARFHPLTAEIESLRSSVR